MYGRRKDALRYFKLAKVYKVPKAAQKKDEDFYEKIFDPLKWIVVSLLVFSWIATAAILL